MTITEARLAEIEEGARFLGDKTVNELCDEIRRLREELAVFREGMPSAQALKDASYDLKNKWGFTPHLNLIMVGEWLRRLSSLQPTSDESEKE